MTGIDPRRIPVVLVDIQKVAVYCVVVCRRLRRLEMRIYAFCLSFLALCALFPVHPEK